MAIPQQGRESKSTLLRFVPCDLWFRKGGNTHSSESGKLNAALIARFNAPEFKATAQKVEEVLMKIMREAAA